MKTEIHAHCRVCGYENGDAPWGEDGETPLFEHCPCCGVEHGYQDSNRKAVMGFREKWIESGMQWDDENQKPLQWDAIAQLANVQKEFK